MNDFGPKRPMSESAETAPTDTAKAKRGRPKKKPDYDRENVRKKACTRLTCSRICDILESWETVALAALIIANLYTVSSRQQSKDRLRCEEEYNGLKYMKNIDKKKANNYIMYYCSDCCCWIRNLQDASIGKGSRASKRLQY